MNKQYKRRFEEVGGSNFNEDEFLCQPPDKELIDSILEYGILEPVIVCEWKKKWVVKGGQKRILVAREHNLLIPALIYENVNPDNAYAWATILNDVHDTNPIHTLQAIEYMVRDGLDYKQIAKNLFKTKSQVEAIARLGQLPDEIIEAVQDGRCTVNTAMELAKKPHEYFQSAVQELQLKDKLTTKFVRNISRQRRQTLAQSLFDTHKVPDTHERKDVTLYAVFNGSVFVTFATGFEEGRSAAMMVGEDADLYRMIPVEV